MDAVKADEAQFTFCVRDNGLGIADDDQPAIFDRFFRAHAHRDQELGVTGTGLGLAIVKHLVLAHGGELAIESEVEQGTTVRFTLPAAGGCLPAAGD